MGGRVSKAAHQQLVACLCASFARHSVGRKGGMSLARCARERDQCCKSGRHRRLCAVHQVCVLEGLRNSLANKCESGAQVGRSSPPDAHLLSRPLLESFPVEQQSRRPIGALIAFPPCICYDKGRCRHACQHRARSSTAGASADSRPCPGASHRVTATVSELAQKTTGGRAQRCSSSDAGNVFSAAGCIGGAATW